MDKQRIVSFEGQMHAFVDIPAIISKDSLLRGFLQQSPFMSQSWLYFDFLREHAGSYSIAPVPGVHTIKKYIDGSAIRQYDFALQVLLNISDSTDFVNVENVLKLRYWQEWIEEQESLKNYPDFGEKVSDYRWYVLDNGPILAQIFDNGMAKYQFFARLQYREVS